MQNTRITHEHLLKMLDDLCASGKNLYAPQRRGAKVYFRTVKDIRTIVFDYLQTIESPKDVLFPRIEKLLSYKTEGESVTIEDLGDDRKYPEWILFGSRPCDAAALKILAEFFQRDIPDSFVQKRRDAGTIISVSCHASDEQCFCTSVGLSPGDSSCSDLLLTKIENQEYYTEVLTEKGKLLLTRYEKYFIKSEHIEKDRYLAKVDASFTANEIATKLENAFSHEIWTSAALRCIGCGACAYVCPVCSCFDIQDEGTRKQGERLRCWDSCAFSLFTLHTSGHNPRRTQTERWRQRVLHKFSYMPEKMKLWGCVGCGRCSRGCPADMSIKEHLNDLKSQLTISMSKNDRV